MKKLLGKPRTRNDHLLLLQQLETGRKKVFYLGINKQIGIPFLCNLNLLGGARGPSGSSALFECKACGRSYTKKGNRARHLKYECGKNPSFVCHLCDFQSNYNYLLSKHLMDVHKVEATKSPRKVVEFFRCDLCPYRGRSPEAVQEHLEKRHGDDHQPFRLLIFFFYLY